MNKWVKAIIALVIVVVVVYGVYRVAKHEMRVNTTPAPAATQAAKTTTKLSPTVVATPSAAMTENSIYKMMTNSTVGSYLADLKGMTLYTYAKDTKGVSNCSGQCLKIWPAYVAPAKTGTLPANVTIIKRSDGTMQYAYKGMPLYYHANDIKAGDVTGNGVGGVWSVAR